MPWPTIASLPAAVKATDYTDRCLEVFRRAANGALEAGRDESAAMRIGHTAARRCMEETTEVNRRIRARR